MTLRHTISKHATLVRSMAVAWRVAWLEVDGYMQAGDRCIVCQSGVRAPQAPGPSGCGCLSVEEQLHLLQSACEVIADELASAWSLGDDKLAPSITVVARIHEPASPDPVPAVLVPSEPVPVAGIEGTPLAAGVMVLYLGLTNLFRSRRPGRKSRNSDSWGSNAVQRRNARRAGDNTD